MGKETRYDKVMRMLCDYITNHGKNNPNINAEFSYALCSGVLIAMKVICCVFTESFVSPHIAKAFSHLSLIADRWKAEEPENGVLVDTMERIQSETARRSVAGI